MDCLVRRDDNTIAYVNKMHKYKSDGNTPRPNIKKNNELQKLKLLQKQKEQQQQKLKQEQDLMMILQMFL